MVIGEGFRVDRAVQYAREEFRFLPAPIEAEDELVQVALKMLWADAVERSDEPGLEIPEDGVGPRQSVHGVAPVSPLAGPMIDSHRAELCVGHPSVGMNGGFLRPDRTMNERSEHRGRCARDEARENNTPFR